MASMSGEQLYERRKRMAEAVRAGKSLGEVAREFRVSIQTVRNACAEQGVKQERRTTAA